MTPTKPRLTLYPADIKSTLKPEPSTALATFKAAVQRGQNRAALIYFDRVTTYAELDARSDAVVAWLEEDRTPTANQSANDVSARR